MKIISPRYTIIDKPNWGNALLSLERIARTCYKSEDRITTGSAEKLIRKLIACGHEAMLEHLSFSVRFVCDRGVSHELVRHRLCSFAQESTRYIKYGDLQFIKPRWAEERTAYDTWRDSCMRAEAAYSTLLDQGWKPEQARSVLPNSLKTEVVITANIRQWRKMFSLRCDKTAHPQMRELMIPLWCQLALDCPVLFDSVKFVIHPEEFDTVARHYGRVWQ